MSEQIPQAKPAKLDTSEWGALVQGLVDVGDLVHIQPRNGDGWDARVTDVIWSTNRTTLVRTGQAGHGGFQGRTRLSAAGPQRPSAFRRRDVSPGYTDDDHDDDPSW